MWLYLQGIYISKKSFKKAVFLLHSVTVCVGLCQSVALCVRIECVVVRFNTLCNRDTENYIYYKY